MRGFRTGLVVQSLVLWICLLPASSILAAEPPLGQYRAAVGLFDQRKFPEARAAFLAILSTNDTPENRQNIEFDGILGGSHYHIGETYFQQEQQAEAAPYYQEVIVAFQSFRAESYYHLGLGKFYRQDLPGAIATFGELAARYPGSMLAPQGLYYQGVCHELLKDKVAAKVAFQTMIERYPQHPWTKKAREKAQTEKPQ